MITFYRYTISLAFVLSSNILLDLTQAEPLKGHNVSRVEVGKYPFVVSINYRKKSRYYEEVRHIFTGSLITKQLVLTAAHCFNGYSTSDLQLNVGSVDSRKGDKYDVGIWISYSEWADSKNMTKVIGFNDIGIIKLLKKVNSPGIKPAPLKFIKTYELFMEDVVLVGWGMTNESSNIQSRYLHETRVRVLPNPVCEKITYDIFKKNNTLPSTYLCTKGLLYTLLDKGDSGGPVLMDNCCYIIAIHIATCPKSGQCDLPEEVIKKHKFNIHVGLYPYKNFILDVVHNY